MAKGLEKAGLEGDFAVGDTQRRLSSTCGSAETPSLASRAISLPVLR